MDGLVWLGLVYLVFLSCFVRWISLPSLVMGRNILVVLDWTGLVWFGWRFCERYPIIVDSLSR